MLPPFLLVRSASSELACPPPRSVPHEVRERAYGAMRRRIGDAADLADRLRSRVGARTIGVDELTGTQDRLSVLLTGGVRGFRVAAILTLVEIDDAVETVIGVVGTRLQQRGVRGLNADPQVEHR